MNAVEDIDSMLIDRSKFMADGAKYFELFEKHIPTGMSGNVLIMSIGNLDCLSKIMNLNKGARYIVVENSRIIKCLSKLFDGALDIEGIENDSLDLYNIIKELDMKFDCIIMNPPYQRNLHLKILAEAIKHLKDDGTCVNLSPTHWLENQRTDFKEKNDFHRFEKTIAKHIKSIEKLSVEITNSLFNIDTGELGIYKCDRNIYDFYQQYHEKYCDNIINKTVKNIIAANMSVASHIKYNAMNNGFCCLTPLIAIGTRDQTLKWKLGWFVQDIDKLFYTNGRNDISGMTYLEYRKSVCWGNLKPKSENNNISFNTANERLNFFNSCRTKFYKYIYAKLLSDVNVAPEFLPWLGDIINPRTGLKGYEGEWTDDDLYKIFNITPEEQKVIEETMEKYK